MPSWRRNRRYILLLAAVSAAILVLGVLFRPHPRETESVPPVAQSEITRLQRLSVRNNISEIARYFAELADLLGGQILRVPGADRSAVVWGSDRVVSSGDRTRPPAADQATGRTGGDLTIELARFVPNRPVTSYRVLDSEPLASNVRYPAEFFESGSWALAVWRGADNQIAYELGQYLGSAGADCDGFTGTRLRLNIELTEQMLGGAVFDYDGALMGLIVRCGVELAALDAATVEASVAAPERVSDRLAGAFGLVVGALSEDERKALDAGEGVLIRQIWRGYQAEAAGLLPGDVVVALDAQPVRAVADLERMTLPVAREVYDLTIVRAGRKQDALVRARPGAAQELGPAGVAWKRPPPGLPISEVDPDGRLAKAGVQAGDRLLHIDGLPAQSIEKIDETLAASGATVFAVFERNGRLWGALI